MTIAVRPWTLADLPAVRTILRDTWMDAYAAFIPKTDLEGYLDEHYTPAKLQALFADPDVLGCVAEVDGVVAGYLKTFMNRIDGRFYVHQLYVLPVFQGYGLGHRLMAAAEERARSLGRDQIWLGVMVRNEPSVRWYTKMGYIVTETSPFVMGATSVDHYIGYLPLPLPTRGS